MKAEPQVEAAVRGVMDYLAGLGSKRDFETVMGFWAPDDDVLLLGTGANEITFGHDAVGRGFARQADGWDIVSIERDWMTVSAAGQVAWTASGVTVSWMEDGIKHSDQGRVTAVLEQRDGRWYILQVHNSVPDARLPEGQGMPSSAQSVAVTVQADRPPIPASVAPGGTVTIMFSDVENSTRWNVALGDQAYVELLREHNSLIRQAVASWRGFEVKSEGDGFMVAFGSARDALRCAIDIQRAFHSRDSMVTGNEDGPRDVAEALQLEPGTEPVKVRIGLHTGEPVKDGDDFYGIHVVMAARIAGEAQGGEILISALMRELVAPSGEFELTAREPAMLKGLQGEHVTYRVQWDRAD